MLFFRPVGLERVVCVSVGSRKPLVNAFDFVCVGEVISTWSDFDERSEEVACDLMRFAMAAEYDDAMSRVVFLVMRQDVGIRFSKGKETPDVQNAQCKHPIEHPSRRRAGFERVDLIVHGFVLFSQDLNVLGSNEDDRDAVVDPQHDCEQRANHAVGARITLPNNDRSQQLATNFPDHGGYDASAKCEAPGDSNLGKQTIDEHEYDGVQHQSQ